MDATEIRKQIFKKHIIAQKHFFFCCAGAQLQYN